MPAPDNARRHIPGYAAPGAPACCPGPGSSGWVRRSAGCWPHSGPSSAPAPGQVRGHEARARGKAADQCAKRRIGVDVAGQLHDGPGQRIRQFDHRRMNARRQMLHGIFGESGIDTGESVVGEATHGAQNAQPESFHFIARPCMYTAIGYAAQTPPALWLP